MSRIKCGDYIYDGYWIDNWIYWISHSYSVYTLQFTIAAATLLASPAITYSLQPDCSLNSQLFSEDCCSARILTHNYSLTLNSTRTLALLTVDRLLWQPL
jgi:hypothetical protein